MFSATLAPLNSIVSKPSWPSMRVVVVARVPHEGVVARAHERGVVAVAAVDEIVALAADEQVLAEAAVHRELDPVRFQAARVDDVVAALRH